MTNQTLTAINGVLAGHWTHRSGTTGTTAVLFPNGAVAGVSNPGHASGTRELGVLEPTHLADKIHGICLSGGSAFGLAAADGVVSVLSKRGIGFSVGKHTIPLVPGAILYDLDVAQARPSAESGHQAAEAASAEPLPPGRFGAGAGATVGKAAGTQTPGGFGCALDKWGSWTIAAGVAVNALGSIIAEDGTLLLGGDWRNGAGEPTLGENTTIAVLATDAALSKAQCTLVAQMATAGLARAIDPVFTPFDGDTVFVAATGTKGPMDPSALLRLGATAASVLAQAVRSVATQG